MSREEYSILSQIPLPAGAKVEVRELVEEWDRAVDTCTNETMSPAVRCLSQTPRTGEVHELSKNPETRRLRMQSAQIFG